LARTAITGSLIAIELDELSQESIHQQIEGKLRAAIVSGRLPAGTRLPSTRIFASEIGVSRNTVLQVFETLTEEGLLTSRLGAGTFVAELTDDGPTGLFANEHRKPEYGGYPFRSLSRRGKSLVASATGEFSERPTPFMPDLPDLREFPIRTWLRLLNETSGRLTGEILADTSNAGYEPLRRAIAQHLNASKGMNCDYTQVIITTGSQQSLDLVCRMLLDVGDPVWLEEPGYIGARSVFAANGATLYPVRVDAEGIDVSAVINMHPAPRVIFTSSSRHYPLGATLSMVRRESMINFARKCGCWIVEDGYDHEFRYSGGTPPSVYGLDAGARTIHLGTFSKVLLPSFRLGYVVVPSDLSESFAKARAVVDRHASLIEQMVLSEFMHRGLLVAHIRRMRNLYRARQIQLVEGLKGIFGENLTVTATETGMHVVLHLTAGADDEALSKIVIESGVVTRPLSPYYAGKEPQQGLLLGFSAFNSAEISQGLFRLARHKPAINRFLK
jgi:GntR family transcriptional regulator/MocR family aminotransferase